MKRETYREQAMANLHAMSRTANGTLDTSASADKKDKLAVSDGETAKGIALHNYEDALKLAWDKRYRVFSNPEDLRAFIEELARQGLAFDVELVLDVASRGRIGVVAAGALGTGVVRRPHGGVFGGGEEKCRSVVHGRSVGEIVIGRTLRKVTGKSVGKKCRASVGSESVNNQFYEYTIIGDFGGFGHPPADYFVRTVILFSLRLLPPSATLVP